MSVVFGRRMAVVCFVLLAGLFDASAAATYIFGPRVFTRATGTPKVERVTFAAPAPGTYVLHAETNDVSSAVVTLNGVTVLAPADFSGPRGRDGCVLEKRVTLNAANVLTVELRSKPGSTLRLSIAGSAPSDTVPPVIAATASPSPNAAGWNNSNVTVTFACTDEGSGIASCPAPVLVSTDAANRVVTGEAVDKAGNRASASITVNLDKTLPGVAARLSTPANASGWHAAPVTVMFDCTDAGSGVASCPAPVTVTTTGANQVISGTVVDRAGNRATTQTTVNLDLVAPSITATASTMGASNGAVTIHFTCADGQSGIDVCPADVTVTDEGVNQQISGTAIDKAGNTARATASVTIDRTKPTIVATSAPAPNGAGWHAAPQVTVTFTCADTGSGVASCPPPATVTTEGRAQPVSGTVTDGAGNTATATLDINLDRTPPSIDAQPSKTGWAASDVVVTFTCSDALSGVDTCAAPITLTAEGSQSVTGVATDKAGNTATASATVMIDRTAPQIHAVVSPAANAAGWHRGDVVVSFECSDALSQIASCTAPVTVTAEGVVQDVSGTAKDGAGNTATASIGVKIDRIGPQLTVTSPIAGATVRDAVVAMTGTVSDALSGVASITCAGSPALVTGSTFVCSTTLQAGPNTIAIDSADLAGNVSHTTLSIKLDSNGTPVAQAGGPYAGQTGAAIKFDGSASSDPDGQTLTYTWTFGDGGSATGVSPTHTFTDAGSFSVDLTVTDTQGASSSSSSAVTVSRTNRPPVANAGGPYTGDVGQTITFSAAQSSDPDDDPLSYSWTFGDGSSATGSVVHRSYSTPGSYTAQLTVTDGRGGTAAASAGVTVRAINQRPTAQIGGPYRGDAGQAIAFAGSGSDPDQDPLSFAWSFGDGASASGAAVSHAFANAGTFTVTLTVSDGRGGSSAASTQVPVAASNRPPSAHMSAPATASVGTSVALSADGSTDPDNDPLTYSWSFGDGRSATGVSPSHVFDTAGTFTVTLVATDTRGASNTATASIIVDGSTQNRPPVASAGGPYNGEVSLAIAFSGSGSTDPDGDPLTYAWDFGDGSTATGVSASHAYAGVHDYTVTLTVSDTHGASHSSTAAVHVAALVDRMPPVVTLSGPHSVLPGTKAHVQAQATDNVGVASVAFEIAGVAAGTFTTAPFAIDVDVPAVGEPGTTIPVKAVARDAAGNAASSQMSLTIAAQPDNEDPVVTLQLPGAAAPGSSIRLGATATDNDGVAKVVFTVGVGPDAKVVATDTEAPFETAYPVPADAAIGSVLQVSAEAFDHTGNHASAAAAIGITETADTTPPVVQLSAPASVVPGGTLSLSATASDQSGIAAVVFTIDGARVATVTTAPYSASYAVPLTAVAGMQLHVEARAVDLAGLDATDARLTVVQTAASGAFVVGEVYDDGTGLPIEGASVTISGSTSRPPVSMLTDDRGRYATPVDAGDVAVLITRDGYTSVERTAAAVDGALEMIDARLTPRASNAQAITPVLGGTLTGPNAGVTIPAGAIAAPTTLTLTAVGQQGLRALLPAGWSPVAIVDLGPQDVAFAAPATLHVQVGSSVPNGTPLTLAAWDAASRAWRAIAVAQTANGALDAALDRTGQFAWIKADLVPAAPVQPAVGDLVAGVAPLDVPEAAAMTITPQPKVMFYQPGVHASVQGVLTTPAPLPSGTRLWARVSESYTFFSGAEVYPDPTVQDLFFYQAGAAGQSLSGTFTASPSRSFEALTLKQGVIGLELYVPPSADGNVTVIPSGGGSVSLASGERLEFAKGAGDASVAAALRRLTTQDLGAPLPADLAFVGALDVTLSGGAVTRPGVLSMPKPADLAADAQVLLVRLATLQDRTRFVLVAVGRVVDDRVVAEPQLPLNALEMEGVRVSGRYVFVKPAPPVGFIAGHVFGTSGACVAGAMVSSETLSIVALSRGVSGEYVAAARVGSVTLTALDLQKADRGTGSITLTAPRQEAALDLRLVAEPPRVTSITPASGATGVALSTAIVAIFSEPIDPATVSGANAANVLLIGPSGAPIPGTIALSGGNTLLTFRPAEALQPDTTHTFTLAAAIADATGEPMGAPFTLTFATLDTTPPPMPPAGSLSASIPENGFTDVRGTQGTAGLHDTVTIENVTRGTSTPALLDPNGGFLVRLQASAGDVLKLKIVDQAGNETIVDIPNFTRQNPDGSISGVVGAAGGRVDGPNGTAVDVPKGSLPDGTIVTVKSVDADAIAVAMTPEQKAAFPFAGGIQVDFGGVTPARYVNVSVPPKAEDQVGDQWIVAQVIPVGGQPVFNTVDTAKLIDGRVRTSSPPCPGVLAAGVYGIYKSTQPVGLAWGRMYASGSYDGLRFVGIGVPFPVFAWEDPKPICLPVLSGRVTVGLNATRFRLKRGALHADDREIIIRNITGGGGESHFRRSVLEYAFEVTGAATDSFTAIVVSQTGQQRPADSVDVKPGPAGKVIVSLDPDTIDVSVASVIIRNTSVTPALDTMYAVSDLQYELAAGGGVNDYYWMTAVDADGVSRAIDSSLYAKLPSMYGPGNLVARAVRGTIDPTWAEIVAANPSAPPPTKWRDHVELHVFDGNTNQELPDLMQVIPNDRIVFGGFNLGFEGEESRQYRVDVVYNTGERESIVVPRLRLVVQNALTGTVVKTIAVQAPPRDEPLGVGAVTNDSAPPLLTGSPIKLDSFDPSMPLTFTFSEAMDADSIRQNAVLDRVTANGRERVAGAWRVYANNRTATFVPDAPLRIGEEYVLTFRGQDVPGGIDQPVTDLGGNPIATTQLHIKTFTPRQVTTISKDHLGQPLDEITDIAIRRFDENNVSKTYLFATTNAWTVGHKFMAFDASDAEHAVAIGGAGGGFNQRQLTLVTDLGRNGNPPLLFRAPQPAKACGGVGPAYSGDLAISVGHNVNFSFVQAWFPGVWADDPDTGLPVFKPCLITSKLLTANPETLTTSTSTGTTHAVGFAEGVATIRHSGGVAVFTAVREVGLFATDIGKEIPERDPAERTQDPFVSGDFYDVVAFQDHLLAANNAGRSLDVFDPNLAPVGSVALVGGARHIVLAENYGVDEDGDGFIRPNEIRNLAFVATRECPALAPCRYTIEIVDLTTLTSPEVIGSIAMPGLVNGLDIDPVKHRLFATGSTSATQQSPDAFFIIDISRPASVGGDADNDGLDDRIIWKKPFDGTLNRPAIDAARGLAYIPVANPNAFRKGQLEIWAVYDNCCDLAVNFTAVSTPKQSGNREGLLRKEREALREGIHQGMQKAAASCNLNASTITILEQGSGACLWRGHCDDNYQPGVSDHDFEVFVPNAAWDQPTPDGRNVATCTTAALNGVFLDPATGESKPITLPNGDTMAFEDITFFPEVRERFESATFDVEGPDSSGSDAVGDMGLGRRSLLLKWLLEGAYVTEVPGYDVEGRSLDAILNDLKNVTKIRRLEGFEWTVLQDFALAKSRAYLRVGGASRPDSAFHKLFVKQLHDAGKAGIRATMARLVAHPDGNALVLDVTRQGFDTNACYEISALVNPAAWPEKPCSSFEEYVASAAARSLRQSLGVFTLDEVVNQANRFFKVKSDRERIASEPAADRFIALVSRFIAGARVLTKPIYDTQLPTDPDVALRVRNMGTAANALDKALHEAKLPLTPHVFSRGFRNGTNLRVAMYRSDAAGSGQLEKEMRVDLAGGEDRYLDYLRDANGGLALANGKAQPIFQLAADLTANIGQPRGVSFIIDLPDRSMKESNRQNNVGGFFYYVLDRATGATPQVPAAPYFPLADTSLLDPDPDCYESPMLLTTQIITSGDDVIGDEAVLGRGEAITITLTVQNMSIRTVNDVIVCSNITNQCYDVGTLAPGETRSLAIDYVTPDEDAYIDGTASAYSPASGVITGANTRLVVNGNAYTIQALMNEEEVRAVDPKLLDVQLGGTAVRHYRIVGRRSGQPKPNMTVTAEIDGFFGSTTSTRTLTFKTNLKGEICTPVGGTCSNELASDDRGLQVPFQAGMQVWTTYRVKLTQVDGLPITPENATEFSFDLKDRDWSQSYAVGRSVEGMIGVIASASGSVQDGFELAKTGKYYKGLEELNLGLSAQASGSVKLEFNLLPNAEIGVPVGELKAEAKGGVGQSKTAGMGEKYKFTYVPNADTRPGQPAMILDQDSQCAITALTVEHFMDRTTLLNKLLDLLREHPCNTNLAKYLVSKTKDTSWSATDSASLGISFKSALRQGAESKLKVKVGADGGASAGFSTKHESVFEFADGASTLKKEKHGYSMFGKVDFSLGVSASYAPPDANRDDDHLEVKTFEKALKIGRSTTTLESYGVTLEYEVGKTAPTSISITYSGPKQFGWKGNVGGDGSGAVNVGLGQSKTLSYKLTRPEDIAHAVESLANVKAIENTMAEQQVTALELGYTPTLLNQEYGNFRALLFTSIAPYTETESTGTGVEVPLKLKGKWLGLGIGLGLSGKTDSKTSYPVTIGVNYKGRTLPLQKYSKDDYLPSHDLSMADFIGDLWSAFADSFDAEFSHVGASIAPAGQPQTLKSTMTATMTIDPARETEPFDAALYSYHYRSIPGPVHDGVMNPADAAGPAGLPHYGIGGFHHFSPNDRPLATPTPLVIDYKDPEIETFDESTFAIYGWNVETRDWEYVGGAVDRTNHTVTATVDKLRAYTVAPRMPAGAIAIHVVDNGVTGSDESATRSFTVTTDPLRNNDGTPVADGTLYTVRALVDNTNVTADYGQVLAADADPSRENLQVAVVNGKLQFQVQYASPSGFYLPGRVVIYSTSGTAFGATAMNAGGQP